MSRKPRSFAWIVLPPLLAVLGIGTVGAPFAAAAAAGVDYAALGDSYSSGVGTPGTSGPCARGAGSYPSLWAADHAPASFRFVACGGATTDDVRRTQLSALDAGTDLVSITIGGNDAGFFPTVIFCTTGTDAACEQRVNAARGTIAQILPGRLDATYRAVRQQAPAARVVVLGYPRLWDAAAECGPGGLSPARRRALGAAADDLAGVIADRARAAGFVFADVRAPFEGHGICTTVPWINNLSTTRTSDSFHPNGAGNERGYLQALNAAASG